MRKSRFGEEQIIGVLKEQQAGLPQARHQRRDVLRLALEVWRDGDLGRQAAEGARGGEPEAEEAPGRADAGRGDAARDAGKKLLTPSSRRTAVTWAIEQKDYSQRRACRLVGIEPKTYRYRSRRPDDGALRRRLRELAAERRRFGYRRLLILLRREGIVANHKRLYRVYTEEGLTVRKRGGRKRALGTRAAGNAWRWWPTVPCPGAGWPGNWTAASRSAGCRCRSSATIDRQEAIDPIREAGAASRPRRAPS